MGRACGMDGRNKKVYTGFWGNLNERDHLEDCGTDGIIFKWIFKRQYREKAWTWLICLRIWISDTVNKVINHSVPSNAVNFLTS